MDALPQRGRRTRAPGIALPPDRMPLLRGGRPLKRWRYVGVFGAEVQLCVGEAHVGPLPQCWWAIAAPGEPIRERTTVRRGGVHLEGARVLVGTGGTRIELTLDEEAVEPVETLSASGSRGYIWTRKRAGVPVRGTLEVEGRSRTIAAEAVVDDSAGYHERHTAWRWSAGVGRAASGERVAWNLVSGLHDSPVASERSVWVDGAAREVGAASFADDLSGVSIEGGGALQFNEWSTREHHANLFLLRSSYRQPFGTFSGELAEDLRLAEGYGVMEVHDARW